ncbi:ImmA/IrrE family metallo-endopeptidase [Staphylococcus aureus]|uniref:spr1629 family repressor/antitoxin n=1 Tax=Staphylococcus aureus TaxID=1280 RepID=UPI00085BFD6A|nr:XRE family transcriptional regulator [Staphylococcus aureus]SCT81111.1 transcriptional regulator [Staphylococcus aureus]SCU07731.1 transcriptional regulator [Staphylococcus aureus]
MFKGESLKYIRTLHGLSRKELAQKINVTEQMIWQYEVKNDMPDMKKVYELSNILQVQTRFFFNDKTFYFYDKNIIQEVIAFRSLNQSTSTKLLNKQYMHMMLIDNFNRYLSRFFNIGNKLLDLKNNIKECSVDDDNKFEYIIKLAHWARKKIMKTDSNRYLLLNLEKYGILIFEKSIDPDADAYSVWTNDEHPIIILGKNKNITARRNFDLAHELGHLLLHKDVEFVQLSRIEYKEKEKEADLFAGAFLLPEAEFKADFNKLSKVSNPDSYIVLKEKWLVSIQAMAIRAKHLNLLSDQQYRYFWMSINKKKYKYFEPLDDIIPISRPAKINSIVNHLLNRQLIKVEDIIEDWLLDLDLICDLTGIDKQLFEKYEFKNIQQDNLLLLNKNKLSK